MHTTQHKTKQHISQQTILTIENFYYEYLISINILSWLSETNALLEEAYKQQNNKQPLQYIETIYTI